MLLLLLLLSCWLPYLQKKYSVCPVEAAELFEKGLAKAGGLSDPRMGTMDKFGGICTTDGANMHDCPGYFGHIEMAEPVYHCKTDMSGAECCGYCKTWWITENSLGICLRQQQMSLSRSSRGIAITGNHGTHSLGTRQHCCTPAAVTLCCLWQYA